MEQSDLEREVETLLGMVAGLNTVISSLVATHPNHAHFQLHLASLTEIADGGALGQTLTARQRDVARTLAELHQQLREAPAGTIQPLKGLSVRELNRSHPSGSASS